MQIDCNVIVLPEVERRSYVVSTPYRILNVPRGRRILNFALKIPSLSRDDKFFQAKKTCAIAYIQYSKANTCSIAPIESLSLYAQGSICFGLCFCQVVIYVARSRFLHLYWNVLNRKKKTAMYH